MCDCVWKGKAEEGDRVSVKAKYFSTEKCITKQMNIREGGGGGGKKERETV